MIQADRVFSTPPTNTPVDQTRRRFLSTAAGIAASGTVLALAISPASAADDPVFALIETHRAASAALDAVIREACAHEDDVVVRAGVDAAHQAEWSALADLIEAIPTTIPGVIASMRYVEPMANGIFARVGNNEIGPLLFNLAEALESLAVMS